MGALADGFDVAFGLISSAMTVPLSPLGPLPATRRAARTVNQPPPAPMSATTLTGGLRWRMIHDAIDLEVPGAVGVFEDVEIAGVGGAGGVGAAWVRGFARAGWAGV